MMQSCISAVIARSKPGSSVSRKLLRGRPGTLPASLAWARRAQAANVSARRRAQEAFAFDFASEFGASRLAAHSLFVLMCSRGRAALSSLSAPQATILSALSGNGPCSAFASTAAELRATNMAFEINARLRAAYSPANLSKITTTSSYPVTDPDAMTTARIANSKTLQA
jgi:hypothetical protein